MLIVIMSCIRNSAIYLILQKCFLSKKVCLLHVQPKATVIANVLADLDEVINGNYLPTSYDADNKGRITRWAAMAIKAKIYLFER